jgi:hypothetical protein
VYQLRNCGWIAVEVGHEFDNHIARCNFDDLAHSGAVTTSPLPEHAQVVSFAPVDGAVSRAPVDDDDLVDSGRIDLRDAAKLQGYTGGKTALYELIAAVRPKTVRPLVRFEGLPRAFLSARFRTSRRALPRWDAATRPLFRVSSEVLAVGRGHDRAQ